MMSDSDGGDLSDLSKDIYNENEDISYMWVLEYYWDVRGKNADDPANFLVAYGESEARYMHREIVQIYIGSERSRHHEQMDTEDGYRKQQKDMKYDGDMDQSSGAEYDMSD
nr:protein PAF1 homolog [Tanacetum cinerariifolium]